MELTLFSPIVDALVESVRPELIVLYGSKSDMKTGALKDADFCVVVESEDKEALSQDLYLTLEADYSFDLLLYTPEEWDDVVSDPQSFAHRILEKGTVLYERAAV